ncbi:protein kinase domain-containing protein [Polyangium aurulentum]|uniref:protein kinase domain-containing protein n=1 Tax=Polyangium aurulentum TaxID=2567896 RepID=UPI0010AE0CD0|nr:AAA family ATPase [Polyangium aurulentum]UQA57665.1 AAA family ATPase [Polyangium aurulentum]
MIARSTVGIPGQPARTNPLEAGPMPSIIGQRYRILGEIGRGGMGTVYRVEHIHTGEALALKVLHEQGPDKGEAMERFRREARAPALIRSEHVVRVTDADLAPELGGAPFFVMELLEGMDLEQRVDRQGPLPPEEVAEVFLQMSRALDRAHAVGLVHRDLKPANLFLARTDTRTTLKILDFGISKLRDAPAMRSVTFDGVLLGTPLYMAPEQATGNSQDASPATDIWAAGLIAFWLLTGRPYWKAVKLYDILREILVTPMPPATERAPELPEAFDDWFARSCHRTPSERFSSAGEQAAALARMLTGPRSRGALSRSGQVPASRRLIPDPNDDQPLPSTRGSRTRSEAKATAASSERRQVTVLHCAVGAASESGDDVDPEDIADVLNEHNDSLERTIEEAGPVVVRPMGEGQVVYFGLPAAGEDDALRAVATGLRIAEEAAAVEAGASRASDVRGWVRIGIHTGMVVVSEGNDGAPNIVGQAPALSLRLGQYAERNSVVISGETFRVVGDRFACERLDLPAQSGRNRLEAFRVEPESRSSVLGVPGGRRAARIVGRDLELDALTNRWAGVKTGAGHVTILLAEPGVGKSGLLRAFGASLQDEPHHWIECRCSPQTRNTPMQPIINGIARVAGISRSDPSEERRAKLERRFAQYALPSDAIALLSSLLAPSSHHPGLLNLSPERQRQKTLEVLLVLLQELTADKPLCFVVEDLHWADPSTLELLELLVQHGPSNGIFTLLTCRPEMRIPWPPGLHLTTLVLPKLPRGRVEEIILELTGGKPMPKEVLDQLVARTDGVPLFVEELTKAVLEANVLHDRGDHYELEGPLPPLTIPATLRESLTARLDNLGKAKRTAQLAATLGREFTYDVLSRVSPLDEASLQQDLAALVSRELVHQSGILPRARYTFKHTLVQEIAYESLLKNARKQHHRHIAEVLEESFPALAESQPEQLAHQWASAGVTDRAVGYLLRAAQKSMQRWANAEAIGQLSKALELLEAQTESTERARLELVVRTALGVPLMLTKGYAAAEVEQTYARAFELGKVAGERAELFPAVWGLWLFYLVRGRYKMALGLADQLSRLAEGSPDPSTRLCAHLACGNTRLMLGELERARIEFERCVALHDASTSRSLAYVYGQDPGMYCRGFLSWTLWLLGYPEQAVKMGEESISYGRAAAHPNSLGFALTLNAWLHRYRRDTAALETRTNELLQFAVAQRLQLWHWHGQMIQGLMQAGGSNADEVLRVASEARAGLDLLGQRAGNSHYDMEIVDALLTAGRREEALAVFKRVESFVQETEERSFLPELYRLDGELQLALSDDAAGAEVNFRLAVETAAHMGARSLGLRAGMSLARLLRARGDMEGARAALEPIIASFTEGLDSEDMRRAKALLEG